LLTFSSPDTRQATATFFFVFTGLGMRLLAYPVFASTHGAWIALVLGLNYLASIATISKSNGPDEVVTVLIVAFMMVFAPITIKNEDKSINFALWVVPFISCVVCVALSLTQFPDQNFYWLKLIGTSVFGFLSCIFHALALKWEAHVF
jgi:hypothetical protein